MVPPTAQGKTAAVLGRADDVTERRQAAAMRDSEERYRSLFNSIDAGFCIIEVKFDDAQRPVDYRFLEVNPAFARQSGLHDAEGRWMRELAPAHEQHWFESYGRVALTGEPARFENRAVALDRWFDVYAFRVGEPDARHVAVLFIDITERKSVEAALRESEGKFEAIANSIDQLIWSTRPDGYHDYYNQRWYEYTGMPEGSTDGEAWNDLFHPDDQERAWSIWRRSLETGEPYHIEYRLRHRSGHYRWVLGRAQPVRDAGGRIIRWFGTCTDIHDLKVAEEERAEQARTLEILNRIGTTLAAELDLERVVQMVTDAGVELTGAQFGAFFYNVTNAAGESYMLYTLSGVERSAFERFPMPRNTAVFAPTFRGEGVLRSDDILADPRYGKNDPHWGMPKGHLPVRSYLAVPVVSRAGEVIGGLFFGHPEPAQFGERHERLMTGIAAQAAIAIDNARLFQATQRLNETLERRVAERTADRDRMWRLTTDVMLVARFKGTITAVNPAWFTLLGWTEEELIGRSFMDFVHPDDLEFTRSEARRLSDGQTTLRFRNRYRHKDGSYRWLSWTAVPDAGFIHAVGRDITEERERAEALRVTEEALRQAQKMEAIGQLTGGVAHDFNNLLTIIRSSSDLLRRPDLSDERRRRYVDAIADTVDRASKLTGQLLAFARRQALKPEVFDVPERVRATSDMLRTIVGARITIIADIVCERCFVEADAAQFETALLNMAVNARDAMNGEGTLTIGVESLSEMPSVRGHAGGRGPFVAVSIADTGSGIPADKLPHIFEPFFTTKEVGKGTGLGLSQVYGFAKQSGGDVAVASEVGRGTTFTLYLPRVEREPDEDDAGAPGEAPAEAGRGRRVLVVEDNMEVGRFSTQILSDLGYVTTWAVNGDEALRLLAETSDGFDVVFSDVVMPGMSGVELGREIRRLYPRLPVVLTSGYSHVLAEEGRHGFELLQKPYAVEELSRVLRRLSRRRPSRGRS
jgi:PAS domain S-box-containing protein